MMAAPKWAFACEGKSRAGDSAGMAGLHVWRLAEDGTATCKKCGEVLDQSETADCFRDWA